MTTDATLTGLERSVAALERTRVLADLVAHVAADARLRAEQRSAEPYRRPNAPLSVAYHDAVRGKISAAYRLADHLAGKDLGK